MIHMYVYEHTGKSYPNYNIREYIRRRAREEFGHPSSQMDLASVKNQLDLVKRQGIVYSLYSRTSKSVMVCCYCR